MKVALKYCGGCNPDYERTDFFEAVKRLAGDEVVWVRPEDDDYQAVLVICGCPTACPDIEAPAGATVIRVADTHLSPTDILAKLREKE